MYPKLNLIAASTIAFALIIQTAPAQQSGPAAKPAGAAAAPDVPGADRLTPSELEELLGPIALYPDALLANVLAASVYPDEVAEAAKWAASGGKADEADAKDWEDPVKAVAKIPDAIKMMGDYPDWTIALGQAYLRQAKDVMDVVQTLRKKAQENGALKTTPQQEVVVEQKTIYIKSVDPQVIYVPVYQPTVVYAAPSSNVVAAGVIGFGVGVAAGLIIANNMDCNWHGGYVGWGHGYHGGGYYGGHNDVNINRGDININGDVNIGSNNGNNIGNGSGNRVGNGNNNGNNVGSGNNNGNRVASRDRVGNEGNAWAPDKSKSLATAKPSEASKFKGGANAANRPAMPSQRPASGGGASGQRPAAGGGASGQRPAAGGGTPTQRPAAGGGASGQRPAAQPSARPSVPPASARPPAATPRPAERPSAKPSATPRPSSGGSGGAFSGGSGTNAASQRGAASRGGSGGAARSGGGGRSAGGGRGR